MKKVIATIAIVCLATVVNAGLITDNLTIQSGTNITILSPTNEGYSSILMVRSIRTNGGADTYPGGLVLVYMDAHMPVDRQGSVFEYSDSPPGTL